MSSKSYIIPGKHHVDGSEYKNPLQIFDLKTTQNGQEFFLGMRQKNVLSTTK